MVEPNPYQSPFSLDEPAAPDGFYTSRLAALRYVEIWRIAETWGAFLNGALTKALKLPRTSNMAIKALEPFKVLREDELSATAREKLLGAFESCREQGFRFAFYSTTEQRGPNEAYAARCLNDEGTIAAVAIWVRVRVQHIIKESFVYCLESWLDNGTVVSTINHRRKLDAPEGFERVHVPGATLADLLRLHVERLNGIPPDRVVRLDYDRLLELLNANKRRAAAFHIRRGFWVPQPEASVTVSAIT